jgi:hypothetical protein
MAGFESVRFEIDGRQYKTTVLDAYAARGIYVRLIKAIAPALEKLDAKALKSEDGEAVYMRMVAAAISGFEVELFNDLCDLFAGVTVEILPKGENPLGSTGAFGLHFAKRYTAMLKWAIKCCQVNGFFDFLSEMLPHATEAAANPSP